LLRLQAKINSKLSQQGNELVVNTTLSFNDELIMKLVIATEDEFKIVITDEEVKKCSTPKLLTDLVCSKMKKYDYETYPSMRAFYVVRKILIEKLGVDRKEVQPETRLDVIILRKDRSKWRGLLYAVSEGTKPYVPLERPMWIKMLIYILTVIVFFSAFLAIGGTLAVIFSLFIWLSLSIITLPFKQEFPSSFQKVKDLIDIISHIDDEECGKEEIYSRVVLLIAIQIGIKKEEIFPNDNFIDNLKIG